MKYALLLSALALCGLAGCVDDDLSLTIVNFAVFTPGMCTIAPGGSVFQSGGQLDVGIASLGAPQGYHGYIAAPIVQNNLIERATATTAETDAVDLTGFDIELVPPASDSEVAGAINSLPLANRKFFYAVAGGRIPPGGMSQVAVGVEVINTDVARVLAKAVTTTGSRGGPPLIVHMRPVGERAGLRLNGGYTDFPVNICKFCLTPAPQPCPTAGIPAAEFQAGGCFPEMDQSVSCCTDAASSSLLCGAQAPEMTAT